MNYLVMFGAALIFAIAPAICGFKRKENKLELCIKVLSLFLFGLYFLRYFAYNSRLNGYTLTVKSFSSALKAPPLSDARAFFVFACEWLSLAVMAVLVCKPFFKSATLDRITLFALPVYCVLNAASLSDTVTVSMGVQANQITFASAVFSAESGLVLVLVILYWVTAACKKQIPLFKDLKSAGLFALCLVMGLLVALPTYTFQFLFGASNRVAAEIKDFKLLHRVLIYGSIALPIAVYYALRHRSREHIRLVLIYFSLVAMFIYCYSITFTQMVKDPTSWPLHLCNTAMFLVPICLIFKTKKLFYFTYFINVFGALAAMLMPNYDDSQMLIASASVRFWYNHYCAFFMPLLLVALKLFDRPTVKQFKYSIAGFCMYFLFALIMNVGLRGFGYNPDYFFLVGDHIANTLGNWAKNIYSITAGFTVAGHEFLFRPVYQALFFAVYVGLGLAMWFVYELFFTLADAHGALVDRRKKIKFDRIALEVALNGRSIEEPMNKDAGIKLELKHFSKKYSTSKNYAVNDANLEVHGGEIFGFLGPNGAGKSTIIKSIVGIQPITEGAIEVCGYDCEKQSVQAKSVIGYVPDHYALYEKLTGREYINYIADIYGVSKEDRTARIEKHIEMFELAGAIDNPIKTYSHGMKQKITIMAALVHDPKLWILDEPLTGLDPNSIHQVKECMKQHAAAGNIVFFSSHIIDVVERICDRITIIKKGKILVTRDVKDIEQEGLLEDYYLRMINGESEVK